MSCVLTLNVNDVHIVEMCVDTDRNKFILKDVLFCVFFIVDYPVDVAE